MSVCLESGVVCVEGVASKSQLISTNHKLLKQIRKVD